MALKLRLARATLPAGADGGLRLAVVADTHSRPHPDTLARLIGLTPDAILHAGDIGELAVLDQLAAVAPVHAVRGNIDIRATEVPDALTLDVVAPPGVRADGDPASPTLLRILVVHIAVTGPRLRADVARLAAAEGASLVVCGHSHVPFIGRDRGLAVFNPGSVGPRRFGLPIVLGSLVLHAGKVTLAHLDCETGLPWSPP